MAEYQMQEMPIPNEEGKTVLYPRMRIYGQFDLDYLAGYISQHSTFSQGEIKGLLADFAQSVACLMADGYSVKIDGLGVFTPALGLRKGLDREDSAQRHNARSICVKDVKFRADKDFVHETDSRCLLERSKRKFRRSSQKYTAEERLQIAQDYLEQHPFMKINDYCRLTGLLRGAAAKELNQWAETEGSGITTTGRRTHKVYVKASPLSPLP